MASEITEALRKMLNEVPGLSTAQKTLLALGFGDITKSLMDVGRWAEKRDIAAIMDRFGTLFTSNPPGGLNNKDEYFQGFTHALAALHDLVESEDRIAAIQGFLSSFEAMRFALGAIVSDDLPKPLKVAVEALLEGKEISEEMYANLRALIMERTSS
jgi:hypothetical protein